MSSRPEKRPLLYLGAIVWLALLVIGELFFSHWAWGGYGSARWFEIGWLVVPPFVVDVQTMLAVWHKKRQLDPMLWIWVVLPFVASYFLLWRVDASLHRLIAEPNPLSARAYTLYACSFLAVLLVWITGFPYEQQWRLYYNVRRMPATVVFGAVALGIAVVAFVYGLRLAELSARALDVQLWLQYMSMAVFAFFTVRWLLPITIAISRGNRVQS